MLEISKGLAGLTDHYLQEIQGMCPCLLLLMWSVIAAWTSLSYGFPLLHQESETYKCSGKLWLILNVKSVSIRCIGIQLHNCYSQLILESYIEHAFPFISNCSSMMNLKNKKYTLVNKINI
jgi:hypothetical protein